MMSLTYIAAPSFFRWGFVTFDPLRLHPPSIPYFPSGDTSITAQCIDPQTHPNLPLFHVDA
jgi:hypothetical protein